MHDIYDTDCKIGGSAHMLIWCMGAMPKTALPGVSPAENLSPACDSQHCINSVSGWHMMGLPRAVTIGEKLEPKLYHGQQRIS